MATVLLVRHGRTGANAGGVLAGRADGVPLDATGEEQVAALAARLVGLPLVEVRTSPLERCVQTAAAICADRGLDPLPDERLVECGYGEWTGQSLRQLARDPLWKVVQAQPSAAVFPAGEALREVSARAVACVRETDAEVTARHGSDALWVAVSHGDVLKAVVADALGLHLDQFQRIVVDPASVSVVRYEATRSFVVRVNDTGGALAGLAPRGRGRRRRAPRGDAEVGGGAGEVVGSRAAGRRARP